jgi:hypothetical protein
MSKNTFKQSTIGYRVAEAKKNVLLIERVLEHETDDLDDELRQALLDAVERASTELYWILKNGDAQALAAAAPTDAELEDKRLVSAA